VVEYGVDPSWSEPPQGSGEVGVVVIDRFGSKGSEGVVVPACGGANYANTGMVCELYEGAAYSTTGTMNQNRLTRLNAGFAMEHLPGRNAVDHEGLFLSRVEVVGDRDQVAGVDESVGGPPTGLGDRRYPLADQLVIDSRTHLANSADEVIAEDERELRLARVAPSEHGSLGEGDAGGEDLNYGLLGSRRWNWAMIEA
jgi:hypothetical protein